MTDLETLFRSVDELSPDQVKELYRYILENRLSLTHTPAESSDKPRVIGLHAHLGKAWLSDDFFDELPDEFWLGEE